MLLVELSVRIRLRLTGATIQPTGTVPLQIVQLRTFSLLTVNLQKLSEWNRCGTDTINYSVTVSLMQ